MACPLGVRINRVPLYNFLVSTSRKKLPTFHELNLRWSKRDKVWSSKNSLFKWRFRRCRRRCYLLGSIMKCIRESPSSVLLVYVVPHQMSHGAISTPSPDDQTSIARWKGRHQQQNYWRDPYQKLFVKGSTATFFCHQGGRCGEVHL